MAESFRALGAGNGFPFCLQRLQYESNAFSTYSAGNEPTLNQTMQSYWNIKSVSYGGAEIIVDNEPKDLICDPNANSQTDVYVADPSPRSVYSVSIGRPHIAVVNGEEYLAHGIQASHERNADDGYGYTITLWNSTWFNTKEEPYTCESLYGMTGSGGSPTINNTDGSGGYYPTWTSTFEVGKVAYETKVNNYFYTVMGLPFVKSVIQTAAAEDYSTNYSCPNLSFLPPASENPSLQFHPYY